MGRSCGNHPPTPGHPGPSRASPRLPETPPLGPLQAPRRAFVQIPHHADPTPPLPAHTFQPLPALRRSVPPRRRLPPALPQASRHRLSESIRPGTGAPQGRRRQQPWLWGTPEAEKKRRVQRRRRIEPLFRERGLGGLRKSAALWQIDFTGLQKAEGNVTHLENLLRQRVWCARGTSIQWTSGEPGNLHFINNKPPRYDT